MAKTRPAFDTRVREAVDRLVAFEPQSVPVVSLYLNLSPDQHGRDNYETFLRKAFPEHLKAFRASSAERASLERDEERIAEYLAQELNPSANGLALFSASGAGEFFEAIELDVPVEEHWLVIGAVPHLYPLFRILDQYPRYAAVLLDTNRARIFVFALGGIERREQVTSDKTRRTQMGGWSQARYQRRADNMHAQHVKEVVEVLDRIVRDERIEHVIVAGDEVAVPLLREHLPKHLEEKLVDVLSLATDAPEDEIVRATLDVLRQKDAETDAERVEQLVGAWQGGGLAVVGPTATLTALQLGQVDELFITGTPPDLRQAKLPEDATAGKVLTETTAPAPPPVEKLKLADELVARAHQTGARVQFIEDPGLLKEFGGVGATLRFRI